MKARSEVYQSLQSQLQTFEEDRLAITAKTQNYAYALIASIVICPMLLILADQYQVFHPFMAIVAALICIAIFATYTGLRQQYYQTYKGKLISAVIQAINPELQYNNSQYITQNEFVCSQIFDRDVDRYKGEDWLKGRLGNTDFECSEIHAEYKEVTRDSKGRRKTTYRTIFKGIFMKADFHKHFSGQTFVLTDIAESSFGTWLGTKFQNMSGKGELVYMENVDFEKQFVVYSTDEVEARYILTINMLERILELKRKFNCDVQLSFIDSFVYIAIPSYDILELDIKESPLNQEVVYKIYEELKMCFDIIDDLNLNKRIWSKNAYDEVE